MGVWEDLKTDNKGPKLKDTSKMGRPLKGSEPVNKMKKVLFTATELKEIEDYKSEIKDNSSFSSFLKTLIFKGLKNDSNME